MARSERKRRQDGFATFGFRRSGVKKRDAPIHGAEPASPAPAGGRPKEAPGTRARVAKPRETRDGAIYMEDDRKVVDQQGRDVYAGESRDEEAGEPKIFTHRPPEETREIHIDEPAGPADEDEYLEEFEEDAMDDAAGEKTVHGEAGEGGEAGGRGVYMPPEDELTTDELLSRLEEGETEVWHEPGDEAEGPVEAAVDDDGDDSQEVGGEHDEEGEGAAPAGDADGGAVSIDWDDAGDEDDADEAPKPDDGAEDDGGEAEPVILGEVEGEVPEEEAFMSREYMAASREVEEEETRLREAAEAAALERRERAKAARYQEILERKRKEARAAGAGGKAGKKRRKKVRDKPADRKRKRKKSERGVPEASVDRAAHGPGPKKKTKRPKRPEGMSDERWMEVKREWREARGGKAGRKASGNSEAGTGTKKKQRKKGSKRGKGKEKVERRSRGPPGRKKGKTDDR